MAKAEDLVAKGESWFGDLPSGIGEFRFFSIRYVLRFQLKGRNVVLEESFNLLDTILNLPLTKGGDDRRKNEEE